MLARVFSSVVKHSTADLGIASSIPLTPTKITKRGYVLVLPWKNAPVYQCFTLGTLKNLVCHVWWALQYLALCISTCAMIGRRQYRYVVGCMF